jgi:cobalt-zinc-cadmium efflux system outer membrane protein
MERHHPLLIELARTAVRRACLPVLSILVGTTGCATQQGARGDVERAVAAWQRQAVNVSSTVHAAPQKQRDSRAPRSFVHNESPRAAAVTIAGAERLEAYIREALERNPAVQAAVADVEAKLEKIPQVTSLPDPILRAIVRPEPIQTAAGDVYFTLGAGQNIPFPAKLDRAGRIAAAEVRMAIEQLNMARLRVMADVERAYYSLYLMDRYIELTAANRALLEDLEQVVSTQYQVGRVPQQDVLRVQTALAKLRDDENRYRLRRASAAAALNQIMDSPPGQPQPVTELLDVEAVGLDVEKLIRLAEEHNPELAALAEQINRDQERIELARLGYWPDVTLGFEWNHLEGREAFRPPPNPQTGIIPPYNRASENGDDNWGISVQMNLPVWFQRIEAAKREARENLLKTQHELRSARNLVSFRIYEAWTRVEAQQQTVQLLQSTLIPQAQQTYEVTLTAYQAGEMDFLNVIDSWRRWLDFELMRHRETVDLETAFSDLQREVGLQLVRAARGPNDPVSEE